MIKKNSPIILTRQFPNGIFIFSYTEECSGGGEFGLQSPTDTLPSPVRPPLRHIDQYIKPEIPNLSKRYTIAILTCVGKLLVF